MKKRYMEIQMCNYQMKEIEEQLKQVDSQLVDVDSVFDSLASVENAKQGDELLIPISNGIFLKAKIEDNNSLFVNVGSDTVVKKSMSDSKALIMENKSHLLKFKEQLTHHLNALIVQEQKLREELSLAQNV